MNILVITGSAYKKGTSSYLADAFIKGVKEAGHLHMAMKPENRHKELLLLIRV